MRKDQAVEASREGGVADEVRKKGPPAGVEPMEEMYVRLMVVLRDYEESRGDMARKVGVTRQAVSAWTRDDSIPSGEALAGLLLAYPELRPDWLLLGEPPMYRWQKGPA